MEITNSTPRNSTVQDKNTSTLKFQLNSKARDIEEKIKIPVVQLQDGNFNPEYISQMFQKLNQNHFSQLLLQNPIKQTNSMVPSDKPNLEFYIFKVLSQTRF